MCFFMYLALAGVYVPLLLFSMVSFSFDWFIEILQYTILNVNINVPIHHAQNIFRYVPIYLAEMSIDISMCLYYTLYMPIHHRVLL